MSDARTLPHSLDAERSVLGAILVQPDCLYDVAALLEPGDFYRSSHQHIFTAMIRLSGLGVPPEFVTLTNELTRQGQLEDCGGKGYIAGLDDGVPRTTNIAHYAKIVKDASLLRRLIFTADRVVGNAYAADRDAGDVLADAERTLLALNQDVLTSDLVPIGELVPETMALLESIANGGRVGGRPTGFRQLDDFTRGLHKGNLIVLGGRPGEGKSALALQLALHVAKEAPVAFFSMEMNREEILTRAFAQLGRIDHHTMMQGRLTHGDREALALARRDVEGLPLAIDDASSLTPFQIRSKAKKYAARYGQLGLVVVDYLQLLQRPRGAQSREEAVAENTWALKMLAGELSVPLLALSQLNRASQSREDKRPTLADLRESGAVEQTANVVLLIYRPPEQSNGMVATYPPVELLIAKQRNGPQHVKVDLVFRGASMRFEEAA